MKEKIWEKGRANEKIQQITNKPHNPIKLWLTNLRHDIHSRTVRELLNRIVLHRVYRTVEETVELLVVWRERTVLVLLHCSVRLECVCESNVWNLWYSKHTDTCCRYGVSVARHHTQWRRYAFQFDKLLNDFLKPNNSCSNNLQIINTHTRHYSMGLSYISKFIIIFKHHNFTLNSVCEQSWFQLLFFCNSFANLTINITFVKPYLWILINYLYHLNWFYDNHKKPFFVDW